MSVDDAAYDELLVLAGMELERLVRRLRNLSPIALASRRAPVVLALGRLVALTAVAEDQLLPAPPELADYALADAMAVIGGDAVAALTVRPNADLLADVTATLQAALLDTR